MVSSRSGHFSSARIAVMIFVLEAGYICSFSAFPASLKPVPASTRIAYSLSMPLRSTFAMGCRIMFSASASPTNRSTIRNTEKV